ncbi:MAG TPA: type II/IV secretion system ATPase subunit [Acidobacteriota bacterium]|nr:type II/IV secretion system ATPase subunit [Acidobacteriota bacterium]
MVQRQKRNKTLSLSEAMKKFVHVREYITAWTRNEPMPTFFPEVTPAMRKVKVPNLVYPVGDPIFIHIFKDKRGLINYFVIEPKIEQGNLAKYDDILDKMVEVASTLPVPHDVREIGPVLGQLYDKIVCVGDTQDPFTKLINPRIKLDQQEYDTIKYLILRNRVGYGKLEPVFLDPNLEDIHCTGVGKIKMIHKVFGMVYTNIEFNDDIVLNKFVIEMSERVERPTSDANSVVDAMMPDGSRANFIYGRDISLEGTSFTLRKFSEVPTSITQIINWRTMSSEVAAYLWICLEHGMNLFVCGETASGKTTTLNAISTFIKPTDKVYTVENTPEVTMPHDCWQHLLTREAGKPTDVTYQRLLIAALRSRPNYIIVGEIRGQEGNIAFQAMQTGHPVMSTFHAGNVTTMIQRITGEPINVPITFVDNLNICLIQQAVFQNGRSMRRVISITELERYYAPEAKMVTRQVFDWDPSADKHTFRGLFNSYILETKIAKLMGLADTREIYKELTLRTKILDRMVEERIFNYFDVWDVIKRFHHGGLEALPFKLEK